MAIRSAAAAVEDQGWERADQESQEVKVLKRSAVSFPDAKLTMLSNASRS